MSGRFFGIAMLILAYLAMQMVACIIIQVQMGYTNFEPALYLRAIFGLSLAEHLLFALLALSVHVIINQKYVGYLVLLGLWWFTQFANSTGIENHLLVFGSSPEWTYSDMAGFGASLIPWAWFKVYWVGWALLLYIVAMLIWVRGKEAGFKARVAQFRERLTTRSLAGLIAAGALIVVTGGFSFYNTSVLNETASDEERLGRWAKYEKTYGKYAALPAPELAGISLRADIEPQKRKATVKATYTLVNRTTRPINAIHLLPDDEVETSAAKLDRTSRLIVNDKDLYYQIYELDTPLQPGDSLHVSFDVVFNPRGFSNSGIDPSVTGNGTWFDGNDWLPAIGYERAREVANKVDRQEYGLPARLQVRNLGDSAATNSTSAKRIAFDAIVSTDDGQTAVAPGELKRTWLENGRRYFHYVTNAPIRNDFGIYSARYAVGRAKWNDVTIEVLHDPRHTTNVDRMLKSARASLEYLTSNFGPYPYKHLRFVEQKGQSMMLHASPINISFQEAFAGLNPDGDTRKFDLVYAVAAHEIAHMWWGNQLSPADVEGAPLLTESLAWFSAMNIVGKSLGDDHLQRLLDMMHEDSWTISSRAGEPLVRINSQFAAYRKGPFAMYALRQYIGEDAVNVALRRLLDRYKSGAPPLPTTRDFMVELKAVTPDSLQPLLSDLFEKNTWWEVEAKNVSASPLGSTGKWRLDLDVVTRKVVVDVKGAETEVPMDDPVEIGIYRAGGTTTRGVPLHLAFHRLKAGAQKITIIVDAKPVLAGIDPRNLLIDADPANNMKLIK
jgi:hypothetical protein